MLGKEQLKVAFFPARRGQSYRQYSFFEPSHQNLIFDVNIKFGVLLVDMTSCVASNLHTLTGTGFLHDEKFGIQNLGRRALESVNSVIIGGGTGRLREVSSLGANSPLMRL